MSLSGRLWVHNLIVISLLLLLLSACASSPNHGLSRPFSERTDIIHAYEAMNFVAVDKGEKNIILFYKSAPVETLSQYRSFDTNVISQSNVVYRSINNRRAAAYMREYIRHKLKQYKFEHTHKSISQAGIAVTISSYQKIRGKNIEELMVVVFDRSKARELSQAMPGLKGYQLLKETAIWVGVVRQVPTEQMDISKGVYYMPTKDFQTMVDLMFENFMKDSHFIPLDWSRMLPVSSILYWF